MVDTLIGVDRFFTEEHLAKRIADWANIKEGERWLEPSFGGAVFVKELLSRGAIVSAVELDIILYNKAKRELQEFIDTGQLTLYNGDFLSFTIPKDLDKRPYDGCLSNPPYGKRGNKKKGIEDSVGLAHRHTSHMLDFSDRVIGLLPTSFVHGKQSEEYIFSKAHVSRKVELIKRPKFNGPDNKGDGARRDYNVYEFEHGKFVNGMKTEIERW